jgi:8-oxo-dGTP pyrophosphatase MutT (NUDIX family)
LILPTTALVAEILIIGLEASVWLWLLLSGLFGRNLVRFHILSDLGALGLLATVAAAYVIGVIVDRIADSLYKQLSDSARGERLLRRFGRKNVPKSVATGDMRLRLMSIDDGRSRFLEYQRSRWRIARATVFNLSCCLPMSLLFIAVRTDLGIAATVAVGSLLLMAAVLSLYAAERIQTAYVERLVNSYEMLRRDHPDLEDPVQQHKCKRAAALCYQMIETDVRFLLVRTSSGTLWTFPKGRIEKGETSGEAATREAGEEAGITGDVTEPPVGVYLYPGHGKCPEMKVEAFLLRVDQEIGLNPIEPDRDPSWFSPEEAILALGSGRRRRYQDSHKMIVERAYKRITEPSSSS